MNHSSRFLHHGVLLIVLHQVRERVEPLSSAHVILPVRLQERMAKPQRASDARLPAGSPTQPLRQGEQGQPCVQLWSPQHRTDLELWEQGQRRPQQRSEGWSTSAVRKGWESWGSSAWRRAGSR